MWLIVLKKLLPSLVLVGLVLALGYGVYRKGYGSGSADVRAEWELEVQAMREAHDQLVKEYAEREAAHRLENTRITHELSEARRTHDLVLAEQRSAYERRLLRSADRAAVYQRQAEAGAAECRSLAGHAAELDRALEEGRALVRELGETLGFRDQQVIRLGQQILNDRKLLAGDTNGK